MGQAKRKLEVKVDLAKMRAEKAAFARTFPIRVLKFFAGVFLFIPFTMIAFGAQSFSQNKWPWDLH